MGASAQELEDLYRSRYRGFVEALATITRSYERAHDAVQEGFARALSSRERFTGGSLDAWVMRIAMNAAIDAHRRDREHALDDRVAAPELLHPERDVALTAALRALPPKRRFAVFLRYFADLSYAEIATVMSISEGTVAATLNQAHAALEAAMTTAKEAER